MSLPGGPPLTVVVLAAGEGTRMRSATAKVLHSFAGRSMLAHVLAAVSDTQPDRTVVVLGHLAEQVSEHLQLVAPAALPVLQQPRNGTGHAVRVAMESLDVRAGTVLVLPGDAPLLRGDTLVRLLEQHRASGAAATLLTSELADPTGYGRVIRTEDGQRVSRVVEHRDANVTELAVHEVSALVYAFDAALLRGSLSNLKSDNSQGEQYLPDVVSLLVAAGHPVGAMTAPATETAGVNDRVQLAAAHRMLNARLLREHMLAGVTVTDPDSTWVDADVLIAADVTLHQNVQLHGHTQLASGAVIGPDSTLTDTSVGANSTLHRVVADRSKIGSGASIGPFAYLRAGTVLADDVHIGTYVEVKNSDIGRATKVPHLSYVGDASIGEATNIGAATVFVNYDGVSKHRSRVGNHARTGADNMFVAPVTIGDGAYTAAGSIITTDVPPGALAIARSHQRNVEGWVAKNRPGPAAVKTPPGPTANAPATSTATAEAPERATLSSDEQSESSQS